VIETPTTERMQEVEVKALEKHIDNQKKRIYELEQDNFILQTKVQAIENILKKPIEQWGSNEERGS